MGEPNLVLTVLKAIIEREGEEVVNTFSMPVLVLEVTITCRVVLSFQSADLIRFVPDVFTAPLPAFQILEWVALVLRKA